MTIKEMTANHLNKEYGKLLTSLERAKAKPNVSQNEVDSLYNKIEINAYLRGLVSESED